MKEPSEELKRVILDLVTKHRDPGLTREEIEDRIIYSSLMREFESIQTWFARAKITTAISYLVERGYFFENKFKNGTVRYSIERL